MPWIQFVLPIAAVVALTSISLSWYLLVPVLVAITYVIYRELCRKQIAARRLWVSRYFRPESVAVRFLERTTWIRCVSIVTAIPLAIITYVTIYSYDLPEALIVAAAVLFAEWVKVLSLRPIDLNFQDDIAQILGGRFYTWVAITLVLIGLATAAGFQSMQTDYSKFTADAIADEVITSVRHKTSLVQHCVRTMKWFDLQLLRVRDNMDAPYGWLVYLFFLIPNALPAFGVVTLFSGMRKMTI